MLQEFRTFVMRGNVLDLAVAVVLGAAFGKIVSSFVSDVLMPPIGLLLGGVDFSNLFVSLSGESYPSLAAAKAAGAPTLNYGLFLNAVLDFVIVAFAVFLLVRQVNRLRRPVAAPAPPDTRECPFCATAIPARARRCPNCTSALTLLVVVGALALAAPALAQTAPSPYTGQDGRDLKALAPEEVRSLLAGEGMGFAAAYDRLRGYDGSREQGGDVEGQPAGAHGGHRP